MRRFLHGIRLRLHMLFAESSSKLGTGLLLVARRISLSAHAPRQAIKKPPVARQSVSYRCVITHRGKFPARDYDHAKTGLTRDDAVLPLRHSGGISPHFHAWLAPMMLGECNRD